MGLDMYVYKAKKKFPDVPKFFDVDEDVKYLTKTGDGEEEFWYWRKHPNLHGWFEKLYQEKGGQDLFNCILLELTIEDLKQLESDLKSRKLPHTVGFCFGESRTDEEAYEADLNFARKAKKAIKNGYSLYYLAWW